MLPFGGWNMPIQYAGGILAEHHHTRQSASLFDCGHMGEFRLRGPQASADLDSLLPRLASTQPIGSCRYNLLLNEQGTISDDIIVYRLAEEEFYIVVNAGTQDADAEQISAGLSADTEFINESAETAKIDLQGPKSAGVLADLGVNLAALPRYFRCCELRVGGIDCLLSRTGYTGELGFELYVPSELGPALWELLIAHPAVEPAGLGARDTLRLEMGYPLYGHEMNEETTPAEAGFAKIAKLAHPHVGRDALLAAEPRKTLVAIAFEGRRAVRDGARILMGDTNVGVVSSGSFSPTLGHAIALAYLQPDCSELGREVAGDVGREPIPGRIVALPFYTEGTARISVC
ncbi:MAG: aminomethyltransferase [Rhodothermales bacterium]|jgi:aminomethyltransferase